MTTEQFQALVAARAREQRAAPGVYLRRTLGMVVLGYAYLVATLAGVMVLLVAALCGAFAAPGLGLALAIPLVALAWVTVRSAWVRFTPPDGRLLTASEAPALFALAEQARRAARAPRWHVTLVTNQFNASVTQHPRLGMFGWHRNYLVLGLPLLLGTTRDELASILAHEMGHLSREHGRILGWLSRQQVTWARVAASMREQGRGALAFGPFLRWFLPRFDARVFVLQRAQEYEADALALRFSGARVASDALVRAALGDRLLDERVWEPLRRMVEQQPAPPDLGPFQRAAQAASEPHPPGISDWLDKELALATTAGDTHPCLRERLQALGVPPRVPEPVVRSAAEELLGAALPAIVREMDDAWRQGIGEVWVRQHGVSNEARREMDALAVLESAGLTREQEGRIAALVEELDGPLPALARWQAMLQRDGDDADAQFHAGRLMLVTGDESGIGLIEQAMRHSRGHRVAGARRLFEWHDRRGNRDRALGHARTVETHEAEWDAAMRERSTFALRTLELDEHGLAPDDERAALEFLLAAKAKGLHRAWLARRRVRHAPDVPSFVLVIERDTRWWMPEGQGKNTALAQYLADLPVPGSLHVVFRGMPQFPGVRKICRKRLKAMVEAT